MENDLSRRDLLKAGGAVLGAAWLASCQSAPNLPDPPAVSPRPTVDPRPIARGPAGQPWQPPTLPQPGGGGIDVGVIPRSQWTRAGVALPSQIYPMDGISRITVHHDGMNAFTDTSKGAAAERIESIRVAQVQGKNSDHRGWADIGYHYVIDPAGRVWEGRAVRYQGAHVHDQNEHNLGIMCLGNYDLQTPTPATRSALDRFVASQMRQYRVPMSRVKTHQEYASTECPGRNMQRYMVMTRARGGPMAVALAETGAATLLA